MTSSTKKRTTYINLDFVRGASALLVLFSHARAFVMVSPSGLDNLSFAAKSFYFVTGFGHQAVMIFFVLSGFFISRSILNLIARNQWSWRRYLVSRMSRLWAVLLPALILTAAWDNLGLLFGDPGFYNGVFHSQYGSGPGGDLDKIDLSVSNFVQNALFLVGVTTHDIYGSNGPLWSLTFEFWYYMIFPMAYLVFLPLTRRPAKFFLVAMLVFIAWILPPAVLLLGLVWLFGYAVLLLSHAPRLRPIFKNWWFLGFSFLLFAGSMTATRANVISHREIGDFAVGLSFSVFMLALITHELKSEVFAAISRFISKISYSLYLVHFSFLAFIATVGLKNQQTQFDIYGFALFLGLCVLSVIYASMVYWLFERNTYKFAAVFRRIFKV